MFADSLAYVIDHIDQNYGAPIQAYQELHNLNFSFVGRNNQLLVNLDERDARINKHQVFVTVYDIPDLNGNYMASPAMTEAFIDRNPLRWERKTHKVTILYNPFSDSDTTFDINVINNSGAIHTYTVENLPKWLSVNKPTDVIDPKSEHTLTFYVNKDTNVGSYDDIIYLKDEDGLSEHLILNITIEGEAPAWYVTDRMKQFSMSIIGRVQIGNDIVADARDIVGVFDNMGRIMGRASVSYDPSSAESLVYITVYDSTTIERPVNFRLWHYDTGKIMVLTPSEDVSFKPETVVGTIKKPLVLKAGSQYVQTIDLQPGWNWMSLNVLNNDFRDVEKLLSWFNWHEGDMLTDESDNLSLLYRHGQWISNKGDGKLSDIVLSVKKCYRVKVSEKVKAELTGNAINAMGDRTIHVKTGWNAIGYTPMVNLPVATALADYKDEAMDGDLVKSKTEFAIYTEGDDGSHGWKGNLKYMKPGEGYMLYRQKEGNAQFTYPYFEPNATFFPSSDGSKPALSRHAHTMSLTAMAEGVELEEGDRLIALANGEIVGNESWTMEDRQLFYISIAGDTNAPVSFAVERDGEIIAIFDISGRKVANSKSAKKELHPGVYIYNGRKQVVK